MESKIKLVCRSHGKERKVAIICFIGYIDGVHMEYDDNIRIDHVVESPHGKVQISSINVQGKCKKKQ